METVIITLDNRRVLEQIENQTFENTQEMIDRLKEYGMSEEDEDSLGYNTISDFMELVNDQNLDNLEGTFIGYVSINNF